MAHIDRLNLKKEDRRDFVITGLPGNGFSTFFLDRFLSDIRNNAGNKAIMIDVYGELVRDIAASDVAPSVTVFTPAKEPLRSPLFNKDDPYQTVHRILALFKDIFDPDNTGIIGPRFEQALTKAVELVLHDEKPDIAALIRVFTSTEYVEQLVKKVERPQLAQYWSDYCKNQKKDLTSSSEVTQYIVPKLYVLVEDSCIAHLLSNNDDGYDLAQAMYGDKHVVINLEGFLDDRNRMTVASHVLLPAIHDLASHSKNEIDPNRIFHMYLYQVEQFSRLEIIALLQKGRRSGLDCTFTVGGFSRVPEDLRYELLKIQNLVVFRQSTADAEILAREFHSPLVTVDTLCMLKRFHAFAKVLEGGDPIFLGEVDFTHHC